MKSLLATVVTVALLAVAGCGGSDSSGSELADLAPPGAPIFVEGTLRPTGELKANADAIAQQVGGVDNLGDLIVEKLESSAQEDGEPFDYEKEVEPWLGARGGLFFEGLDEEDDPTGLGMMVESTDTAATQEFIDNQVEGSKEPYESGSYEGVDFEVGGDEDNAIGVVGDFLAIGEDEKVFKEIVDASSGEALAGEDTFSKAIAAASDGSLADVYVDVGDLIDQSGGQIDPQVRQLLDNAGIDPSEATAVASVVPGSDQVVVELSSDLAGQEVPVGDASHLLGQLPSTSFAAIAFSGFGEQVKDAIDRLDKEGIPNTIPPGQLKKGLKDLGIDLEGVGSSVQDAAVFVEGDSKKSLGGALVLATIGPQASKAVSNLRRLLLSVHVAGVAPLTGKYNGFLVHNDELGDKPLVVMAKEGRAVIGYGLPAAVKGLLTEAEKGKMLSETSSFRDAVAALDHLPISGFVQGPAALRLADSLIPSSNTDFEGAKTYLKSIRFLALGAITQDKLATAKLIVGIK